MLRHTLHSVGLLFPQTSVFDVPHRICINRYVHSQLWPCAVYSSLYALG